MSTKENKNVDIERYPLKSLNSIILRADGGDGGGGGNNNNNNNNTEEDEDEGRHSRHIQISAADSKSDRYRDEAELAHFGKRQQLKVSQFLMLQKIPSFFSFLIFFFSLFLPFPLFLTPPLPFLPFPLFLSHSCSQKEREKNSL